MARRKVSTRLKTTGLVSLVLVNVVLVGMALRSTTTNAFDSSSTSSAKGANGGSSPKASAKPTKAPAPSVPALAAPLQTMLVAIDGQQAWRARSGTCADGGAKLDLTQDGGRTWVDAKTPLGAIARVRPADGKSAFVIGADSGCVPELRSTTDNGLVWGSASSVASAWFRDPKDAKVVVAPGKTTSRPCTSVAVIDLAVVSAGSARALCANGIVRSTTNSGSSWTDAGTVSGAVALAVLPASPDQTYVIRVDAADCHGIQLQRIDQSVATSCVQVKLPKDPGQISLSLVKGGGWLSVGETTMRSADDLVTWSIS